MTDSIAEARPPSRLVTWAAIASAVAVGLAVPVLAVGRDTGRWPLQEDLRGPDGYLGPLGYLQAGGDALTAIGRAWVRTVFPTAADQQHGGVFGILADAGFLRAAVERRQNGGGGAAIAHR